MRGKTGLRGETRSKIERSIFTINGEGKMYIDKGSYIQSRWTDRIGETKVAQNSTFVSTCFRSGTARSRAPEGYDIASQSDKVENGLTGKTARTSRASATGASRASRHAGSQFRGSCMGKKQRDREIRIHSVSALPTCSYEFH